MNTTEKEYKQLVTLTELFEEKALDVLQEMNVIKHGVKLNYDEVKNVTFYADVIEIQLEFQRRCGCCPDDVYEYDVPISYLFNPNWKEELKENVRKEKEQNLKEAQRRNQQAKEEELVEKRKQYEKLKKELGEK